MQLKTVFFYMLVFTLAVAFIAWQLPKTIARQQIEQKESLSLEEIERRKEVLANIERYRDMHRLAPELYAIATDRESE